MLTTISEDGTLHSLPMSLNRKIDSAGNLWFFTYGSSHKVLESQANPQVGVSFSDTAKHTYVAISGRASLVRDKVKIEELWEVELKAWFPDGVDTPDIALLKVEAEKAELWDSPSSVVAQTIAMFRALTGAPQDVGENIKVDLKSQVVKN